MKQQHIEKIEAYLQSEITRAELQRYAEQEGITDLDENIEWVQNTILAVEAEGLREQLKLILPKEEKREAKVRRLSFIKWISGIAASLLLLFVAYWGMNTNGTATNAYAQYEYQEPGLPVTMSQSDNYALYDALTYFGEANYGKTIEKLEAIAGENSDTVSYYLGASYYYEANYESAIQNLSHAKMSGSAFAQEADWLLVMSYLKDDNKAEAEMLLNKLIDNTSHKFYQRAKELKANIKK